MHFRTFALVTLGCKVNQYEAQALREAWTSRGLAETNDFAQANFVCLNTCAVTANAVADARALIRRANRENPNARIIVTGCAAEAFGKELGKLPGVFAVAPQSRKAALLSFPKAASLDAKTPEHVAPEYPPFAISGYDRSRAVLKVQDGCSHRCTYCIVPLTRGTSRSRAPRETIAEAKRLLDAGFREIVVNGINLAQYGRDFTETHDFWDLVALLEKEFAPFWTGVARFRLSSIEPGQLGQKALDVLGASSIIAPHLHVSLQSGAKGVLRRMGRGHYDPSLLQNFCRSLKDVFPIYGFGADILSGFPGETESDSLETEELCARLPFSYAHVFPYSRRPGTPAASWPNQTPKEVKKERAARLRQIFFDKKQAFIETCVHLPEVRVALESEESAVDGAPSGLNEFYVECAFQPDSAPCFERRRGLVAAKPIGADKGRLAVALRD